MEQPICFDSGTEDDALWGDTAVEHLAELVLAGYIHPEPGVACSIDKTQSLIGLACEKHLSLHAVEAPASSNSWALWRSGAGFNTFTGEP